MVARSHLTFSHQRVILNVPHRAPTLLGGYMATVDFGSKVPAPLYERFKEHLPIYGAVKFFINTSLENFVSRLDEDPSLVDEVKMAVDEMVDFNRKHGVDSE